MGFVMSHYLQPPVSGITKVGGWLYLSGCVFEQIKSELLTLTCIVMHIVDCLHNIYIVFRDNLKCVYFTSRIKAGEVSQR